MKYILEPIYEAYASKASCGFRPGRSTWDVMMNIFFNLRQPNTNYKKRILELDIKKCFDKINHNKLMNEIHLPIQMQRIIISVLKAGVLHERSPTQECPAQGEIISPLLCNIASHAIDDLWNQPVSSKSRGVIVTKKSDIVQRRIRYADDMVFFPEEGENENELWNRVD